MSMIVSPAEFHLSFRVSGLEDSTVFYTNFLGVEPKDRTPRFSTFIVPHLRLNLVLLINDSDKPLDTYSLYHIGLGVSDKAAVVESYFRARANGAQSSSHRARLGQVRRCTSYGFAIQRGTALRSTRA